MPQPTGKRSRSTSTARLSSALPIDAMLRILCNKAYLRNIINLAIGIARLGSSRRSAREGAVLVGEQTHALADRVRRRLARGKVVGVSQFPWLDSHTGRVKYPTGRGEGRGRPTAPPCVATLIGNSSGGVSIDPTH